MKRVSPTEAYALLREAGYHYLDVRSVPEFEAGHPEGAFNVPWLELTASGMLQNTQFLAQVSSLWPLRERLVVGCKAVARAEQAAQVLIDAGFQDLTVQRAGMEGCADAFGRIKEPGWRAQALPVALEALPGRDHATIAARLNRE